MDLFWRKQLTGAGILFLLNRYLTLALRTSVMIQIHITSSMVSKHAVYEICLTQLLRGMRQTRSADLIHRISNKRRQSCAGFIKAYAFFDEFQYLIWGGMSLHTLDCTETLSFFSLFYPTNACIKQELASHQRSRLVVQCSFPCEHGEMHIVVLSPASLIRQAAYFGIIRLTGLVDPLDGCGTASTAPVTLAQSTA